MAPKRNVLSKQWKRAPRQQSCVGVWTTTGTRAQQCLEWQQQSVGEKKKKTPHTIRYLKSDIWRKKEKKKKRKKEKKKKRKKLKKTSSSNKTSSQTTHARPPMPDHPYKIQIQMPKPKVLTLWSAPINTNHIMYWRFLHFATICCRGRGNRIWFSNASNGILALNAKNVTPRPHSVNSRDNCASIDVSINPCRTTINIDCRITATYTRATHWLRKAFPGA